MTNRKFAIVILVILLAIGLRFLFFRGIGAKKDGDFKIKRADKEILRVSAERQKDTDGDGLKDWEEALWKTDLLNPDTDGDGASDGEEVKLSRNPIQAGPDDSLKNTDFEFLNITDEEFFFNWEDADSENLGKNKEVIKQNGDEKVDKPIIFSISPSEGPPGTTVTMKGSGFTPLGNTVYAGYAIIYDLKSLDGETLTFKVEPILPQWAEKFDYPLIYWFYLKNANGLSNYGNFQISL